MSKISRLTSSLIFIFYDIFLLLGFILYLPVYFWRKKINLAALAEKFGFIARRPSGAPAIWLQAVSVGEIILLERLLRQLQESVKAPVVISTTTLTGYRLARKKYADRCLVMFFPLDVSWIARSAIEKINPWIFIAVETEIWPNFFRILYQKGIPVLILNARISDQAFGRYRYISGFLRPLLHKCSHIGVQNELYKQRYVALGADPQRVSITGNLKLSNIAVDENKLAGVKEKYAAYLRPKGRLLWLAASTHQPEEEIILGVYQDLQKSAAACSLLLAPRHPDRAAAIERLALGRGFNVLRLSKLGNAAADSNTVFLVDTIGDLIYLYSLADICFVGGSLSGKGGHNILEPMHFLKPTVFGPSMENFTDIAENALEHKAAVMVKDAEELRRVMRGLLDSETLRQSFSSGCRKVFESGENILTDNLRLIRAYLVSQKDKKEDQ